MVLLSPFTLHLSSASAQEIEYTMTSRKTYEIASIEVEGADSYEDFVLIGFSGLAVGDKIEVPGDQITKAIKRFWKQGLFSSVKIKAKKIEGNKIWLVIQLEQRPRVSEVKYEGLKKSEREDVEVKVGIRQGSQMTPNLEDHAKTVIQKYLAEKGFHNSVVNVMQQNDPDHKGYVRVLIAVDKKAKTKVGKIYLTGNKALTDVQINKAMKKTNDNHIVNLFRTKKFVTEEYEKDKQAVIEKYNEYGYRDAHIVADSVVPNPDDPARVDIYMTISEGDKYYVRSVKWVGNTIYPYDYLDAVLGIKPGDVYNLKNLNERLQTDDDAVSKLYQDRGYLFFNVDPVEVNVENDSIDFEMRIYEGKPATINEIKIVGNTRVYEHVVRRELYTKPGQLYSQSDIMRSLRELAQMGHFDPEKLTPDIQPNPEEGTVDVTYNLETKSSDQIEFSLGWGAAGIQGKIGLKFTNFAIQNLFNKKSYRIVPQGEGQTFAINLSTNGLYYTSVSLSFMDRGWAVSVLTISAPSSSSSTRQVSPRVTTGRTTTCTTPTPAITTIPATTTTTSSWRRVKRIRTNTCESSVSRWVTASVSTGRTTISRSMSDWVTNCICSKTGLICSSPMARPTT
jgi:outer membrane protein insertion porin family